jgi:NAD(P)-dependent dehydrogenase (short-subunit alcohol dehydrogenase family)
VNRLSGKTAAITGAGSGIARAAASLFAAEGAKIAILELQESLGREVTDEINAQGGDALFVQTDVTVPDSVEQAMHTAAKHFGGLNTLFNCAGGSVAEDTQVTSVGLNVWDHTIALDLKGPFLCCRYGIPYLLESQGGTIINVSSVAALKGTFPAMVYSTAKGGVISLTRALAGQYSRHNIRSNAICPGVIMTERVRSRFGESLDESGSDQARAASAAGMQRYPFGVGEPGDIANIALFLASDESRMINGAVIPAEGGMSVY